ncbi:lysine N(6)-hydroxylase/L-ornithine N(5)-oxygenase family protein [Streptomyces sp. AM 4-1-1]|uniref:lysine N(6)-hydroxylase/L-ornithine N(5)-oxygenase family protein n=1 Tax=Streptomyces sp. AM 4-1-1 TaxID=3028710 RepID=UPI0023B9AEFB|nr:lysine N(6)-hydroxylase/L-ornithine N(5)-oxygenase family protein [Streptomyces sp. AM 4-1-1]WEH35886.1 lysine N(6)-hydroxylase/L-ornithine N(5)-oxygenase family protein [Streptomyces sp. AM 4-1-1]
MSARQTQTSQRGESASQDVVGIGFGPANLALAIAIEEHNGRSEHGSALRSAFVERQEHFGWHRGMLIEGATMQVSFLKDLATMRDPGSRFTFLRYLQDRGRLADFINQKSFFPTRVEFHDYFRWCAAEFTDRVAYGHDARLIRPVERDGVIDSLDVVTRPVHEPTGSAEQVLRARNIVLATGLRARLPEGITAGEHVWHNQDLLFRAAELKERPHRRFVVVGAGQSAAETADHLHRTFPDAQVCAVFSRYGYSPADDSPFANRIFDPHAVDDFYGAPQETKDALLGYHGNTNYSVVDGDLIEELYRTTYQEKVSGTERLRILNATALTAVEELPDGVRASVRSLTDGETYTLDADAIVFATGYRAVDPRELLGELAGECLTDELGRLRIGRDHRVLTTDRVRAGVYLQGAGTEHTHGITSSLLSTLAVRSGEICDSLLLRRTEREVRAEHDVLAGLDAGTATADDGLAVPNA